MLSCIDSISAKYKGEVFIFSSGPSANKFPLKENPNKRYIAVNGAVRKFIEHDIPLLAYVFNDGNFAKNSIDLIISASHIAEYLFLPEYLYNKHFKSNAGFSKKVCVIFISRVNRQGEERICNSKWFGIKNLFNANLKYRFNPLSNQASRIGFSKDIRQGYFCARTIAYAAIQIAYSMGFNKVYLIGVDLNSDLKRFYDKGEGLPSSLNKDYSKYIQPSFKILSGILSESFQVYNLSKISKLDYAIIPYMDVDQALDNKK